MATPTVRFCLCVFALFFAAAMAQGTEANGFITATCRLGVYGEVDGFVSFVQSTSGGPTQIVGVFKNVVPKGLHGWHVHELPITDDEDPCGSAGGHYNPHDMNHGSPFASERHVGDLGNFRASAAGVGVVGTNDFLVALSGENSVVGRTLVIHGGTDDLGLGGDDESLRTGNAGPRIGCCVIEKDD